MPRSPTVLTPPPGTLPFTPNTTIESGKANAVWLDLYQDGNTPRPIAYGGTGASNAQDALNNLGAVGQSNFLDAFSVGDGYYSVRDISSEGGAWLRRDGALYDSVDYPELAALLPSLPDGVEWSPFGSGISGTIQRILVLPSEILVATASSGVAIYRSTDFANFSLVGTVPGIASASGLYRYGSNYVLCGTDNSNNARVSNSSDGVNWSSPAGINSMLGSGGQVSIAYNGTTFLAAGSAGAVSTSTDLVTWSAQTSGVSTAFQDAKWLNSNFVLVGSGGGIVTSPNGTSFTPQTSGVTVTLYRVAFGNSTYVVFGAQGNIRTSTNLTAWTPRTSGTTAELRGGIVYSSSGFLGLGDSGICRISSDANTWVPSITGTSSQFVDVDYNKTNQNVYYAATSTGIRQGVRTLPTQFRVPNDSPQYGWIKAEND